MNWMADDREFDRLLEEELSALPLPDAAATARADAPEVEFYSAIWDWMSRAFG